MKKLYWIVSLLLLLLTAGYLFVRFSFLKTNTVKADAAKAKNVLDLRPQIIAKLQELVKQGSNGLYNLSIERIEPSVVESKVEVFQATLTPDEGALKKLDNLHLAPDNVFEISFNSLQVDGIGIEDFLHKDRIDIARILINEPVIKIFHTKRAYNKSERIRSDTSTLYQLLMKKLKSIKVNKVDIRNSTVINHDVSKNKKTRFNNVFIILDNILIDSSTQFDRNRFLFAKDALVSTKDFFLPTPDSLYFFRAGTITVSGARHSLIATNVQLQPRGNKEQFTRKLAYQKERYDLKIPRLTLDNVDWYDLINWERLYAKEIHIFNPDLNVFFDRSLPLPPTANMNNYPSQLIMKSPLRIFVQKVQIDDLDLVYEEFNPRVSKGGAVIFKNINSTITNITNMPDKIFQNNFTSVNGKALFMGKVPAEVNFRFDLNRFKTGKYTAEVHMQNLDSSIINPIAQPLGEFKIKTGFVKDATASIDGDNYHSTGRAKILYRDLKLIPLKKDTTTATGLKKKTLTGFFANTFLIKNENPSRGEEARIVNVQHNRRQHASFFSFTWKTILAAVLKTIGLPAKLAER